VLQFTCADSTSDNFQLKSAETIELKLQRVTMSPPIMLSSQNSERVVLALKNSHWAGMRRVLAVLLLAAVAQAQGPIVQGAMIKGTVILNGEGGQGVGNVQITDSAHTGGPWASDSDGGFNP
jgi:hypothetical protein